MRNQYIFHRSRLDDCTLPVKGQQSLVPHPVLVDNSDESYVQPILDSTQRYWKRHYLAQCAAYSHIRMSRELFKTLNTTFELIHELHSDRLNQPRR